jgi:hypothetical protein
VFFPGPISLTGVLFVQQRASQRAPIRASSCPNGGRVLCASAASKTLAYTASISTASRAIESTTNRSRSLSGTGGGTLMTS